jgi:hypothetical protein
LEHQSLKEDDQGSVPNNSELPEHLNDLYCRSKSAVGSENERQLADFLIEFQDLFSSGQNDLGNTSVTTHKIDVEGAIPIKQRARRLPIKQRDD